MRRWLLVSDAPIDEATLIASRIGSTTSGAVVRFSGLVRELEGGVSIAGIDYEAFQAMAEHQFQLLFNQMERRWPISSVRLVHRTGRVAVGEPSLWLEIESPHRAEAFAAAQWLIDQMKSLVPIWKHPYPAPSP